MRRLDSELQARLDSGATTLCRCWKVERRDGRVYGFTDHDEDLSFGEVLFKASSGLDATALQASTGLSVDNGQVMGALSDAGVTETEIRAGRFDRARIEHWLVDWTRPELRTLMFVGSFGEIRRKDRAFEVELRGLAEALNTPVGRTLQRKCDRRLGDEKCRVDREAARFAASAMVEEMESRGVILASGLDGFSDGWFTAGTVIWTSGGNVGDRALVKADGLTAAGLRRVAFWREAGVTISAGDQFRIYAGCDRSAETCRAKFDNFLNFRGFPHIPGDDWVAAYPKNGEVHDGSSRS